LKTELLTDIVAVKSNRIQSNLYFKIGLPKPKFSRAVDEKNQKFSQRYQLRKKKMKKNKIIFLRRQTET